ncbi:MAG: phenylalanine--tRNA ligase subunit beta [Candidatus Aenigmarchaeota archaeon]|nr:phenylalanine--tRNA ligase subunit beta [Candidatus Aenigmarchaeota archaeon]
MPTIEVSYKDLCGLIGRKLSIEQLKDLILFAKGEIDAADGDLLKVDIKDANRPHLWSAEGIAREIKGRYTSPGCPKYSIGKSSVVVNVDKKNKNVRPYTVCAIAKNLKVTQDVLSQLIQLQEKIHGTFGRNRKEVAMGVYDLNKIKSPIRFTTVKPDGIKFAPLDFQEKMTPKEILEKHPKGKEYGHLLKDCKEYPIFIDSANEVLSIPPIINSNHTGKITEKTKDVFIECSGFNFKFLMPALNVIVSALYDRGAKIESVKVVYPDQTIVTPNMEPKKAFVDMDYANKISGLNLTSSDAVKLLKKSMYNPVVKGKRIEVEYPAYRQDILHQRDIVEDVIISYGFNNIEPVIPKVNTVGNSDEREEYSNKISGIMSELGFQGVLSYTLTNKDNLFGKMNVKEEQIVEIENFVSLNWNVFRNWMLPSLMEFLSNNQHVSYPQNIFEIGDVVLIDEKEETKTRTVRKIVAVTSDSRINYQNVSSVLDALMNKMNLSYKLVKSKHSSFIEGRVANVVAKNKVIGFVGEIHPSVLKNWKLEMPCAAFEINLEGV